ncbi:hypothetical protein Aduo_009458 [Ancylostoma duodenale]
MKFEQCLEPITLYTIPKPNHSSNQGRVDADDLEQCPQNAEWRNCTSICPELSCQNYKQPQVCFSLRCGAPGCMCKDGYLLLNFSNKQEGCVKKESCPQQTTQAATSG